MVHLRQRAYLIAANVKFLQIWAVGKISKGVDFVDTTNKYTKVKKSHHEESSWMILRAYMMQILSSIRV